MAWVSVTSFFFLQKSVHIDSRTMHPFDLSTTFRRKFSPALVIAVSAFIV